MPENPFVVLTIIGALLIAIGICLVLLSQDKKPKVSIKLIENDNRIMDTVEEVRNDFQRSPQDH